MADCRNAVLAHQLTKYVKKGDASFDGSVELNPTLKGRGGTWKARHAATPFGAMLNYVYTVALGQCTRACVGLDLDLDLDLVLVASSAE